MPPFGRVPAGPYYAVLHRVRGGYLKLIIPEVIMAGLPEKARSSSLALFGSRCCRRTIRLCSKGWA